MSEELLYFNEDTQEQLQMMESALLDSLGKGASIEYVGTIFRAMHMQVCLILKRSFHLRTLQKI